MATRAFQKIYTKITQITKATCSLNAAGIGNEELAEVNGRLAQVVKIIGDAFWNATINIHYIQLCYAFILPGENDLLAIGRNNRIVFHARMGG